MNRHNKNKKASRDIAVMVTATRVLFYRLRYAALALVAASVAATATLVGAPDGQALGAGHIIVDSTADSNAPDGLVTLREAILLANGGVGGDGASSGLGRALGQGESDNISGLPGAGSADTIGFSDPPFAVENAGIITLYVGLPNLTAGNDVVDGLGRGVRIDGAGEPSNFSCIIIDSSFNTVKGLQLTDCISGVLVSPNGTANAIGPGNTIYDNQYGVRVAGQGNTVKGNMIGTTVEGADVHPDGGNSLGGINVTGPNNVIGGANSADRNIVSGNEVGIELPHYNAVGNVIKGNYIGTDVTGTLDRGNTGAGVLIKDDGNTVGGSVAGEGNLISGNGTDGIYLFGAGANGNTVRGNYIGTDASGTASIENESNGVEIETGTGNHVGGTVPGSSNLISGNINMGIRIAGGGNFVEGNLIGTTASGTAPLGNKNQGVRIDNAANNVIAGNVIVDSGDAGIRTHGTTPATVIKANFIGTDSTGTIDLGNGSTGVHVDSNSVTVGGVSPSDGNLIAFNTGDGVSVTAGSANVISSNAVRNNAGSGVGIQFGTGHRVSRNVIRNNGGLGIDIAALPENPFGVTTNDAAPDSDTGPNNVQNYPMITSVYVDTAFHMTTIDGTLESAFSTFYTLDFYYSYGCDASGYGEGDVYLDSGGVMTNAAGVGNFSQQFDVEIPAGTFITATATDPNGNTSEFSNCKAAWDDADDDNDGFPDSDETLTIGTNAGYPCGFNSWPADLWDQPPLSANKITVQDLTAFIAPVRRLGTSPGDANFNARWDLVPGKGIFSVTVNVQDMTKLVTLAPPMLNGARALNGPLCPMPSQ